MAAISFRFVAVALLGAAGVAVGIGVAQGCGGASLDDKRQAACEHACTCAGDTGCASSCDATTNESLSVGAFSASLSSAAESVREACFDCVAAATCQALASGETCLAECGR